MLSLFTIAMVATLAVGATGAYFSDTATSYNNTMSTGTLDLKVADNDESWADGVSATWSSPANWKPGQEFKSTIRLANAGTVPADVIYAYWNNLKGNTELANKIEVTWIEDSTTPGVGDISAFRTAYNANGDQHLSLAELINGRSVYASPTTPAPFQAKFYADPVFGSFTNPVLPFQGGEFDITLGYKLMEDTDNSYQGKSVSFDVAFQATQMK